MFDTTNDEESIFDSDTQVEPASDEQQEEEVSNEDDGDTPKSFEKFAMKTNMKINELSQSLKDSNKLNSYYARGLTTEDIIKEDPEFAKRLSKQEGYSDFLKESNESVKQDSEQLLKEAISDLVVDGKRLSLKDRQILKAHPEFNKVFKGFFASGFSPEESANRALKESFPKQSSMVEYSVLGLSSEETPQKKESPRDALEKIYDNPKTFPAFMRQRIKK